LDLAVDGKVAFAATGGRPFDGSLPAVVMIHGAGMDHTVWTLPARSLAHRGRAVLAPDLAGHGRSQGPPLANIPAMAAWLLRLMDAAGVGEAALVGHSMGAIVALAAATDAPGRVRRLVLLGAAGRMPVHPDLLRAAANDRPEAADLIVSWGHGPAGHLGGGPAPGLWLMGGARRLLERALEGVLASDLAACESYDALGAAGRVACPALLLLGAEDKMTPPSRAKALAAALRQVETVLLPGAGHMLTSEVPDAVIDALLRFV
jgi:pimeloyl-ACP methyl ester carboxylesterase